MRRIEPNPTFAPNAAHRPSFRPARLTTLRAGLGMATVLLMPPSASALGIGELTLHSKIGQPLLARVPLSLEPGETLSNACLALLPAAPGEEDASVYMTRLKLSLSEEGGGHLVTIRSNGPINEPFAKVRLQVKCEDAPAFIRTFTLLPEFDETILPTPSADKAAATESTAAHPVAVNATTSGKTAPGKVATPATPRPHAQKKVAQASKPHPTAAAQPHSDSTSGARLKLSGATPSDKSPGTPALSDKRIQDSDDQTAKILALQQQIKQMEEQLNLLNLKLAQYAPASASTPSMPAAPLAPASAPDNASMPLAASSIEAASAAPSTMPQSAAKPAQPAPPSPAAQPTGSFLDQSTSLIAAAALAVLLLLLGLLRLNRKRKAQWMAPDEESPSTTEQTLSALAQSVDEPHTHDQLPVSAQPEPETPPKPETSAPSAPIDEVEASAIEDDAYLAARQAHLLPSADDLPSLIEEAELYALHGYPDKGQEILRDIVEKHPDYQEAWMLLFSILSSLNKTADFEAQARRFSTLFPGSSAWAEVCALGRQLDSGNLLYAESSRAEEKQPTSAGRRKPIGEILLETGAISVDDLIHSLANFDSKRDGRIGNYLISLGLITQNDLDQALHIQEGGNTAPAQSVSAPKTEAVVDPLPHILEFEPSKPAEPPKE